MGLGNTKKAKYLSISKEEGKVRHKQGETETLYDYLEGRPDKVDLRKESYQGNEFYKYYFWFTDGEQNLVLQSSEGSTFSRSLLNSLAGMDDPSTPIRVIPYQKDTGERTYNVPYVVYAGTDETVSWAVPPEDIPDTERAVVGEKEVFDDTARRKFFRKMAAAVNKKLESADPPEPDLPDSDSTSQASSQAQGGGLGSNSSPSDAYKEVKEPESLELPEDLADIDDDLPF